MTSESGRERILGAATRLFAALGYDGTSTRLIAEAAGLNIATVAYHVGGKRDLYLAVMEQAHRLERDALESAVAESTPDAAGVLLILDRYLDFCVEHPEVPALWMHRWLSDAADVAHLEGLYAKPLMEMVAGAVRTVVGPGVDVEYTAYTVVWCTHGFCRGGVLDDDGRRRGLRDPRELARFRAHLHRLVAGSLRLPGVEG
ncbi:MULTISPECIES: TetR/AcrR family transcriptional regulator [Thermomonosporaceae]|uniref:TetR/AcrR family transcriptional regulator n=1 Tax=Thermomonosporaceae TaxID=2012 RepID=UPI00255AB3E6|nr:MULTISPECIES: TetR/AcrR family transcriptional regulator [Thermomonosporaceae]MDL4775880.1 TetR/AcrR family transcriptional regulator [Actinomadura xylanilytica]